LLTYKVNRRLLHFRGAVYSSSSRRRPWRFRARDKKLMRWINDNIPVTVPLSGCRWIFYGWHWRPASSHGRSYAMRLYVTAISWSLCSAVADWTGGAVWAAPPLAH